MNTRFLSSLSRHNGWRVAWPRNPLLLAYLIVTILSTSISTVSLEKPQVAFVETHMEDELSLFDYWDAAVSFKEIGLTANLLSPYTGITMLHPNNLTNYVALLLITPRDIARFDNDIEMLAQYVAKGNGLIITGQSGSLRYEPWARRKVNELTARFGVEFESDLVCDPEEPYLSDPRYPQWPMITRFSEGEISEGVKRISYIAGCSLELSGNATAVAWTSDEAWSDLDGDKTFGDDERRGKRIIAAVSTYGKGRVACIGDDNLWTTRFLGDFDNRRFLLNLLKWVSGPIERADVRGAALDISPEVAKVAGGNYSAVVPLRLWNQGNAPAENVTIYSRTIGFDIMGGNVSYKTLAPGEAVEVDVPILFSQGGCTEAVLGYEYHAAGSKEFDTFRAIRLSADFDLRHLGTIFGNRTEIAMPTPGGPTSFPILEIGSWGNITRDIIARNHSKPLIFNHTAVCSKSGTTYSIQTGHIHKDLIAIGDPSSNYLSAYVSQEGKLKILGEDVPPRVLTEALAQKAGSLEELVTGIPRLEGNLSQWGYLSLFCEANRGARLAAGGFGPRGVRTAVQVMWKLLRGEFEDDEFSGTVALFRGVYDDQGNLIRVEFL